MSSEGSVQNFCWHSRAKHREAQPPSASVHALLAPGPRGVHTQTETMDFVTDLATKELGSLDGMGKLVHSCSWTAGLLAPVPRSRHSERVAFCILLNCSLHVHQTQLCVFRFVPSHRELLFEALLGLFLQAPKLLLRWSQVTKVSRPTLATQASRCRPAPKSRAKLQGSNRDSPGRSRISASIPAALARTFS